MDSPGAAGLDRRNRGVERRRRGGTTSSIDRDLPDRSEERPAEQPPDAGAIEVLALRQEDDVTPCGECEVEGVDDGEVIGCENDRAQAGNPADDSGTPPPVQRRSDEKVPAQPIADDAPHTHVDSVYTSMVDTVHMAENSTRSALIEAGVELLEETGSTDITLRAIARRAGVSHGAPRRWFPTHRALLGAIAGTGLRDLSDELRSAADGAPEPLRAAATAYVEFARRRPAMFGLIFRHDLIEGSGAELRTVSRPLFDWLVDLTGDASSREAAAAMWVGVHGIAVLSSTGALELAAGGIEVQVLVDRVVGE